MLQIPEPPFSYYRVAGSERLEWLQGQLTQDVLSIRPGEWKRAAVLSATGQLLADGAIWVLDDHCILGLDRRAVGVADRLASRIIMEDVVFSMIGDPVKSFLGEPPSESEGTALRIDHVGEPGFDIFGTSTYSGEPIDYEVARVEAGVPLAGVDYDGKVLAMEMGPHFIATRIAFDKGCYTGQEIVERIRSRGHTNRQRVGLRSDLPIPDSAEARITSRAVSPRFGHIALAFVKNELASPGSIIGEAAVVPLPFR